ncbi:MAG: prevent-host-death protein [Prevotellaceae bacterium]|jgi:PHD/YefM family antitoxin component YafN of YafNO toxin-antitoxin module|nr:prevent-host-death protein [Prevotellaceae bacterium]
MIVEVTGREFRAKQKVFLDLTDNGTQVVIRRGKNKAYVITPMKKDDDYERYFTPAMLAKIDESLKQAAEGKVIKTKSTEELLALLDSL